MAVEQKGPGGVSNSYGRRETSGSKYDLTKRYGDIVSEQGEPDPGIGVTFSLDGNKNPVVQGGSSSAISSNNIGPRSRSVVLLGDSRDQAESIDTDTVSTGTHYNYNKGVFTIANALADQRMILVKNSGIGGNKFSDLIARYNTDAKPYASSAKWLIIWCDVNDINAGVSLAEMQANNTTLYNLAIADGFTVIEYLGYAPGSAAVTNATWTAAKTQQMIQFNSWRKKQQSIRPNYITVDAWAAITDASSNPAVTPDIMLADATGTALHIGVRGATLIAQSLANIIRQYVPLVPQLTTSAVDNFAADNTNPNIFDRGMFLGTAGTNGTGATNETSLDSGFAVGVANGMTVQRNSGAGTVYTSTGPASSGVGNAQRMRITGTTVASETYSMVLTSKPLSRAVAGASYEGFCRTVIESPVQVHAVYMRLSATFKVGGVSKTIQCRSIAEATPTTSNFPNTTLTLTHRTPRLDLPANMDPGSVTVFEPAILIIFDDTVGGGSAKISVEQMSMNRVS